MSTPRNQQAIVILTTIIPPGTIPLERRPYWSPAIDPAIREVNAFIQSLAGPHVLVFDAYALLADETGHTRSAYQRDFLHLNAGGYALLNQELASMLARLIPSP